jgi:hypothetical protein
MMKRTITMLVLMGLIFVVGCEDKEAACSKTKTAGQCSLKQGGCTKTGACCKTSKMPCKCPAGKCTCKKACKCPAGKCTCKKVSKTACKCPAGKCECKLPCGCKKGACKCEKPAATTEAKKACCGTCKK